MQGSRPHQEVRKSPAKPPRAKVIQSMQKFTIPKLQWEAQSWYEILDWDSVEVFLPFILERLSDEDLEDVKLTPQSFPDYSCHSQSVQRVVKLVSSASQIVCGEKKRQEHILSLLGGRKVRKVLIPRKIILLIPESFNSFNCKLLNTVICSIYHM